MSFAVEVQHQVRQYSREAFLYWLEKWAFEWDLQEWHRRHAQE